jgi:hypothetical protein
MPAHYVEHRFRGRPVRQQDRGRADRHGERHGVSHAVGEEKFSRGEDDIVFADADDALPHQARSGHRCRVDVFDTFRLAGRPGGVHPKRNFVRQRGCSKHGGCSAFDEFGEIMNVAVGESGALTCEVIDENNCAQSRQAIENGRERLRKRRRDHDRACATVGENKGILLRGQQRVERQCDDAGAQRTPKGDRKIDGVVEEQCEPFLGLDPEIAQRCRKTAGTVLQFAVTKRTLRIDEGNLFGQTACDRGIDKFGDSVIRLALQQVAQHRPASPFVASAVPCVAGARSHFLLASRVRREAAL